MAHRGQPYVTVTPGHVQPGHVTINPVNPHVTMAPGQTVYMSGDGRTHPNVMGATHHHKYSLEDVFRFLDKDGNGSIDKREMTVGLRAMGLNPTDAEVDSLIRTSDTIRPDGRLQLDEFRNMVHTYKKSHPDPRQEMITAFRVFDRNGDGVIDKNELRQALTTLGFSKLSNHEVDQLFRAADTDGSGVIDFNELVRVLTS